MIRFTAETGTGGALLGLGLTEENVRLLAEGRPIRVLLAEHDLPGTSLWLSREPLTRLPEPGSVLVVPTRVEEYPLQVELRSVGVPRDGVVLVFVGDSVDGILGDLQGLGLVGPATGVTDHWLPRGVLHSLRRAFWTVLGWLADPAPPPAAAPPPPDLVVTTVGLDGSLRSTRLDAKAQADQAQAERLARSGDTTGAVRLLRQARPDLGARDALEDVRSLCPEARR